MAAAIATKMCLQYKYDESARRIRRVSSQERTTFFGVKKRFAYVGLGVFILAGVIVGVFIGVNRTAMYPKIYLVLLLGRIACVGQIKIVRGSLSAF